VVIEFISGATSANTSKELFVSTAKSKKIRSSANSGLQGLARGTAHTIPLACDLWFGALAQAPSPRYQVPGTRTRQQATSMRSPGIGEQVPGASYQAQLPDPGIKSPGTTNISQTRCKVQGHRSAGTGPWVSCTRYKVLGPDVPNGHRTVHQQGLRQSHEGPKKGLSKKRKAKGKKPKGRLMSIAQAVSLKIFAGREAASCHPRESKATERKLKGRPKAPATTSVRKERALDHPREASPNVEEAFWLDAEEGAAVEEDMDIGFVGLPKIPIDPAEKKEGIVDPGSSGAAAHEERHRWGAGAMVEKAATPTPAIGGALSGSLLLNSSTLVLLHRVIEQSLVLANPSAPQTTLWLQVLAAASRILDLTQGRLGERANQQQHLFALLHLGAGFCLRPDEESSAIMALDLSAGRSNISKIAIRNAECEITNCVGGSDSIALNKSELNGMEAAFPSCEAA